MFQSHPKNTNQSTKQPCSTAATIATNTQRDRALRLTGQSSPASGPSLSPAERTFTLRQQAMLKAQQGAYGEAIELLTILVNQNPSNASDYNNRGLLYFQSSQFEQALKDYNQALRLSPRLAKVYNNRANCHAALGQLAEALIDYETAIDLNPANLHAWINQGITYRDLEMYGQAIENFDIALQFSQIFDRPQHDETAPFLEGHIYAERGRANHLAGDWNCAVADYHRAIANLPTAESRSESATALGGSHRLRQQVERWLSELLSPLNVTDHN